MREDDLGSSMSQERTHRRRASVPKAALGLRGASLVERAAFVCAMRSAGLKADAFVTWTQDLLSATLLSLLSESESGSVPVPG
jgi:hypothetical protein